MAKNKKVVMPRDCLRFVMPLVLDWYKEHFFGIYLSTRNIVIKVELISLGTLNASLIHPRELFRPAIMKRANQIIILHDHPSGEVDPSEDYITTIERLKKAVEKDVYPSYLQKILGHANLNTTMFYMGVADGELESIIAIKKILDKTSLTAGFYFYCG